MPRIFNYMECDCSFEEAQIILVGFPYDGTSSYRPGSRFAPPVIREASYGLESYSPYLDLDLHDKKICDEGDVDLPFGDKTKTLSLIREKVKRFLVSNKKVLSLGGEHLISYPIIQEYVSCYPDLHIIHFDAHTDLRESYLGEKESHATVLKRIYNTVDPKKIFHFGMRSGTKEEFLLAKEKSNFYPYNVSAIKEVLQSIDKFTPLYITLDLDVLDPSVLPGTGTPEPGGITFNELLNAIHSLKGRNIVGADLVELSPDYDPSKVSNSVAAKLVREMLLIL